MGNISKIKIYWPECKNELAAAIYIFHKIEAMERLTSKLFMTLERQLEFSKKLVEFCSSNVNDAYKLARLFKVKLVFFNVKKQIRFEIPESSNSTRIIRLQSRDGSLENLSYIFDFPSYINSAPFCGNIFELLSERNESNKGTELAMWSKENGCVTDRTGVIRAIVKFGDESKFKKLFGCGFTIVSLFDSKNPKGVYFSRYEQGNTSILRLVTRIHWPSNRTWFDENDKFTLDYAGLLKLIDH